MVIGWLAPVDNGRGQKKAIRRECLGFLRDFPRVKSKGNSKENPASPTLMGRVATFLAPK